MNLLHTGDEFSIDYPLNIEQKIAIRRYLDQFEFTRKECDLSYASWAHGGSGWDKTFNSGGSDTVRAIMWYQHRWKAPSREWRPSIIMNALCKHVFYTIPKRG